MLKLLALTVKPKISADTRYRIMQYIPYFEKRGIKVKHSSLLNETFYTYNINNSKMLLRIFLFIFFYIKRFFQIILITPKYDVIWISRELSPIGPPLLEKILFFFHKKVVLDIDDAIFLKDENINNFTHKLRDFKKFEKISHKFHTIVCGNQFLAKYFLQYNSSVKIIPTVINFDLYSKVNKKNDFKSKKIIIGWVGTPFYYNDFELIKKPIEALSKKYDLSLMIIGLNKKLNWNIKNINYIRWQLNNELKYFTTFDIGIMPLRNTKFEHGKCGFKIIQYMAAGIPVIASPVGVNKEIINDNVNGFLAYTEKDWYDKLEKLIVNPKIRKQFSIFGKETVKNKFSLHKYQDEYYKILLN